MIRSVRLRRFKRFEDVDFQLPGHVVVAGPNNTGKTTLLQAIAAWSLSLERWRQLNDFNRRRGGYTRAPIPRPHFSAVPLRVFDLLWHQRADQKPIEIEVEGTAGWSIAMELIAESTEQIYVHPRRDVAPEALRSVRLPVVFVPAMSGLGTDEPVFQRPKIEQLLGQAKPGDVLRNLLVQANEDERAWAALVDSIGRLFHVRLHPADSSGPHILAEYSTSGESTRLDVASAGSGFQQVLMLLTFLHTRPASVLLLDEPDAHLHVILQDAIYGEVRAVAARQRSQLLIATHSEVVINAVEPRELCVLVDRPRMVADSEEKARLIESLGILSHEDILRAMSAPGVLYLEDYTDLEILRAWARTLNHPALDLLTVRLYWKRTVHQPRPGASGIHARDHYEALQLVRPDLPGLELVDGDARREIGPTEITGRGLQRLRWRRYEIESYLVQPTSLARFVEEQIGSGEASRLAREDLRRYLERTFRLEFIENPAAEDPLVEAYLEQRKARTEVIPPILAAAGLPAFPYTRYHEIAAVMKPEEIHPEVVEKLDAIVKAFGG